VLPFENRRSKIQLISEILRLLRLGEVGKTEVMYTVGLTHSQTDKYLLRLVGVELIDQRDQDGRTPSYRITQKGLDILSKIESLQESLRIDEVPDIVDAPELKIDQERGRNILRRIRKAIQDRLGDKRD
jgi:predicted transcriptional regulator